MLYIASDHRGYQLKKYLARYLDKQLHLSVEDMGPTEYVATDDLQDFAIPLAKNVLKNPENRGILICGSGQGMCMTANRFNGIHAIMGYSIEAAEMGRRHGNGNIICLAADVLSEEHAAAIVKKFLETEFDNDERLLRRLHKMNSIIF